MKLGLMESSENITRKALEHVNQSFAEIIVVRHGETEWNALGKIQGQMDIDLNEVGRQQAHAIAERLSKEPDISVVYSSDLKRASETAEIIAAKHCGLKVIKDGGLREGHVGDLQGVIFQDLPKLNPKAYEALKSYEVDQEIPGGGESRRELYNRCTSSLKRIGEKHRGERVIVVTHGAVKESLYKRAQPGENPRWVANASISVIQLFNGDVWSIKSWNDVSHLRGTQCGESTSGAGHSAS